MTVESQITKVSADCNGSALQFSFSPLVLLSASSELQVTLVSSDGTEEILAEGEAAANYKVHVSAFPGTGYIDYPADLSTPAPSGQRLVMKRMITIAQPVNLENQGGYFPEVQEQAFDRGIMIALQQQEELDRSLKVSVSDNSGADFTVPSPSADKVVGWNADGTGLENKTCAGNVTTPEVTTLNALVRWDDTDRRGFLDSSVTVDDSGNMAVPGALGVTGDITIGGAAVLVDGDIGVTVQAYDADLAAIAGLSPADGQTLVRFGGVWTAGAAAAAAADQTARDMAMVAIIQSDVSGDVYGPVVSYDFSTDSLATKANATHDAGTESYNNLGAATITQGYTEGSSAAAASPLLAQSFQVSSTDDITKFRWYALNSGTGESFDWTIETDGASGPSGTLVAATAKADAVAHPGASDWQEITLDAPFTPATGTTYWLCMRNAAGGNVPLNTWTYGTTGTYTSGSAYYGGAVQAGADHRFGIYQMPVADNMTLVPTATTLDTANPLDVMLYVPVTEGGDADASTNVQARVSVDGGTTYTTAAVRDAEYTFGSQVLLRFDADTSGQTGSSFLWEITTLNNDGFTVGEPRAVPLY